MPKRIKQTISENLQWFIVAVAVIGFAFNSGILYNHIHGLSGLVGELVVDVDELKTNVAGLKSSVDVLKVVVYRLVPDVQESERNKYVQEKD